MLKEKTPAMQARDWIMGILAMSTEERNKMGIGGYEHLLMVAAGKFGLNKRVLMSYLNEVAATNIMNKKLDDKTLKKGSYDLRSIGKADRGLQEFW